MKLESAIAGADAAIAEARSRNVRIAVAVCDDVGRIKAFLKMDDLADVMAGREAMRRAIRAAASGAPSESSEGTHAPHLVEAEGIGGSTRPGGRPCRRGDTLIGSIGVAGADDETSVWCAEAGAAVLSK